MNNVFKKVVIGLFSAFIFVNFAININLLGIALKVSTVQNVDFTETVATIQQEYISNLKSKNFYINLNGLFARVTGKIIHNDTTRLKNGMLTHGAVGNQKISEQAESIKELDIYLKDKNIPFLYVQAPYKMDDDKTILPKGVKNLAIENMDELLGELEKSQINYLDLRPYITKTVEMVEENFYATDHHWNTSGAFIGFQKISERLQEMFPGENIVSEITDINSWEIEKYENIFLGSQGKRVGKYFGGTDDFLYYYPKFETNMSSYIPKYNRYKQGTFEDVIVNKDYLDEPDYFNENTYVTYIGGDYPLYQHYNYNGLSDLKVLLIKDSFSLPIQAFLCNVFTEVDVIDPRYFKDYSIAEYIDISEPDVVIMLINPTVIGTADYLNLGVSTVEEWNEAASTYLIEDKDITIEPKDSAYNFTVVADSLQENAKYNLSLDEIKTISGNAPAVGVSVYDSKNNTHLIHTVIDTDLANMKGEWTFTFITPETNDGSLQLLLYAGESGKTGNIGIEVHNISLKETEK